MRLSFAAFFYVWSSAFALCACSGHRADSLDSLGGSCSKSPDCPEGDTCVDGLCRSEANAQAGSVRASGSATGAPASVAVSSEGGTCENSTCSVQRGATITFRAPDVDGYRFTGWHGDVGCAGTDAVLVLVDVASDIACVADYVRRVRVLGVSDEQAISAQSGADFADCSGARCEVDLGSTVELEAGEAIDRWVVGFDGVGCEAVTGPRVSVVATDNVTCTARYEAAFTARADVLGVADITVDAASDAALARCENGGCRVVSGSDVTFSAPAVPGYRFAGYTGDPVCSATDPTLLLDAVHADTRCVANYVRRIHVRGVADGVAPLQEATRVRQTRARSYCCSRPLCPATVSAIGAARAAATKTARACTSRRGRPTCCARRTTSRAWP